MGQEKHILLVEDNRVAVIVAEGLFKKLGCTVDTAENGKIAVEMATKNNYDAISMDIGLPEMDGIAACRAIRKYESKHPERHPVTIIAVSANTGKEEQQQYLDAGMQAVMPKPFTIEQAEKFLSLCECEPKSQFGRK